MTILTVANMNCGKCVGRITDALTEANLKFTVSLADKTVTVDGDENSVAKAKEELDDLGFDAV